MAAELVDAARPVDEHAHPLPRCRPLVPLGGAARSASRRDGAVCSPGPPASARPPGQARGPKRSVAPTPSSRRPSLLDRGAQVGVAEPCVGARPAEHLKDVGTHHGRVSVPVRNALARNARRGCCGRTRARSWRPRVLLPRYCSPSGSAEMPDLLPGRRCRRADPSVGRTNGSRLQSSYPAVAAMVGKHSGRARA